MSELARWSYANTATIRPFVGIDDWTGQLAYGEEYEIACNWIAAETQERMAGGQSGSQGAELVMKHEVFTEDPRPGVQDMILLNGMIEWEEVRSKTSWDMALFEDTLDFKLVTG